MKPQMTRINADFWTRSVKILNPKSEALNKFELRNFKKIKQIDLNSFIFLPYPGADASGFLPFLKLLLLSGFRISSGIAVLYHNFVEKQEKL